MEAAQDKRRQYAKTYYEKHKETLKGRYKSYRETHKERDKQLRQERWLINRYIPVEIQREILEGDWLEASAAPQDSPALSTPGEPVAYNDI